MKSDRPPSAFSDLRSPGAVVLSLTDDQRRRLDESYRPWRKLRYVAAELTLNDQAVWSFLKSQRSIAWQPIGVTRAEGGEFGFVPTRHLIEPLFIIDRSLSRGDAFVAQDEKTSRVLRERWNAVVRESEGAPNRIGANTLMEEAAESSIMEGAATTRREAIDMLRAGRSPVNRGERMVLNNYQAMQRVKEWITRPLSIEMILELQDLLTEGTLDDPTGGGRLRRADEPVRIVDSRDDSTVFVPPAANTLPQLLTQIVTFANAPHEGDRFIHPLIKASILHFLIGYAHPFIDGNGRTARALFYWSSLRAGYEIFEYLTISDIIRKGFAQYPQAYLDTELDDGDLTYFILFKLGVIQQSIDVLSNHLRKEQDRLTRSQSLLALDKTLNLRQRLLLEHSLRHRDTHYTAKSHANSNGIALNTARSDLESLVKRKLMVTSKRGKEVVYMLSPRLENRLAKLRD